MPPRKVGGRSPFPAATTVNRSAEPSSHLSTTSFPKQDSDYASGCAYVDINLIEAGGDVFTNDGFNQHAELGQFEINCTGMIPR